MFFYGLERTLTVTIAWKEDICIENKSRLNRFDFNALGFS
jgi:hypothetical protein